MIVRDKQEQGLESVRGEERKNSNTDSHYKCFLLL